jgi:hypothetical protein
MKNMILNAIAAVAGSVPVVGAGLRPAVRSRLQRRFNKPDKWDFREYAGDGFGWFQSRQTGELSLHKITVRNASSHVKKLSELE